MIDDGLPLPPPERLVSILFSTRHVVLQHSTLQYCSTTVPGEILRYTWATKRSCYGVERMIDARLPLPTPEHLVSIFYSPDRVLLLSSTQEALGDGFGQQHNFHCQFTKIAIFKNLEIEKSSFPNSLQFSRLTYCTSGLSHNNY